MRFLHFHVANFFKFMATNLHYGKITDIINKYTVGEAALEETNAAPAELNANIRLEPGKHELTALRPWANFFLDFWKCAPYNNTVNVSLSLLWARFFPAACGSRF